MFCLLILCIDKPVLAVLLMLSLVSCSKETGDGEETKPAPVTTAEETSTETKYVDTIHP